MNTTYTVKHIQKGLTLFYTWPRPDDGQLGGRFLHSDIKNVAYFFVHPVFRKIVEVGGLNQ